MLNLLKRDLKLHWDVMILPFVVLVLAMAAVGISNEGAAVVGVLLIGSLFVPFLPMAIHLRENSQGTLGDLVSLPCSRRAIVSLRYIEILLFAGVMIVLVHIGTWVAQSAAAHRLVPFGFMDRSGIFLIGMLLVLCFAYPMPFTLRWDGKGLATAFVLLMVVSVGLSGLVAMMSMTKQEAFGKAYFQIVMHLVDHPAQVALGILALFSSSYLLSLKAFTSRDF
jgi:hypothetical protein